MADRLVENRNDRSYTTILVVEQSPEEVFAAVTDVRGWWSQNIAGDTAAAGDEFTYRYKDAHYCRVQVTEALPGERVVWQILDNRFDFIGDQSEWIGTEVVFDIDIAEGKTRLRFAHLGLLPDHECFDVCSNAWRFYVGDSLRKLITTGVGQPNPKEKQ
jgi:hypothetical protein